jgi:predicted nucleic acid-binding protein
VTLLVLDASAVVDLLLRNDSGVAVRRKLIDAELRTVSHLDAEVFSALARLYRAGTLGVDEVDKRLRLLARLDIVRLPISDALLREAWALRDNVMARDALYVALARRLRGRLLTTDDRLARAVPDIAVELARSGPDERHGQ